MRKGNGGKDVDSDPRVPVNLHPVPATPIQLHNRSVIHPPQHTHLPCWTSFIHVFPWGFILFEYPPIKNPTAPGYSQCQSDNACVRPYLTISNSSQRPLACVGQHTHFLPISLTHILDAYILYTHSLYTRRGSKNRLTATHKHSYHTLSGVS